MELSFIIIAGCLAVGLVAAVTNARPNAIPDLSAGLRPNERVRTFSPKNTLFIIGPAANTQACRMQRRLLKPSLASLIREDVHIIELYGDGAPKKNGETVDWLDPALLRHAMDVQDGFATIYVDDDGKTQLRSDAPVVMADVLRFFEQDEAELEDADTHEYAAEQYDDERNSEEPIGPEHRATATLRTRRTHTRTPRRANNAAPGELRAAS